MLEKLETWHYRSAEAWGLEYDYPLTTYEIPGQPQKNGNISQLWWRVRGRFTEAWGLE
jgi:hypothetical protein